MERHKQGNKNELTASLQALGVCSLPNSPGGSAAHDWPCVHVVVRWCNRVQGIYRHHPSPLDLRWCLDNIHCTPVGTWTTRNSTKALSLVAQHIIVSLFRQHGSVAVAQLGCLVGQSPGRASLSDVREW